MSRARGPAIPLIDLTISQQLKVTASAFRGRTALVARHQGVRFTWRELEAKVTEWARGLAGMGLETGDRVDIWSTNCWEWVVLQLACARAGLVLVNVNPAYRSHELGYIVEKSRMKALFLWEQDPRANYREIFEQAGGGTEAIYLDGFAWMRLGEITDRGDVNDVVNIQYTSGTTGSPKGVLLTHRNILNNGFLVGRQMKITEEDKIVTPVPLYHCFGCVMGVLCCVVHGSTLVLPSWTFDAKASLEAVHHERAIAIYGVPTMFIAELQLKDFASYDLSSLRTGIMAGAPCPIEVMKRVVDEMHCREITIAYGLTEASPVITMSSADDPLEVRVSTVGAAMPETEVKIDAPAGEQGELCTRGYLVMKGYDGEEEATAHTIDAEDWLHTGDLAVMREDGNVTITGRAKDMIIRGGENIYPREIEEFLYTHPKIADVQVVGLPDLLLGETTCAWVRLKEGDIMTEDDLREFCKGKIAHFKVPQHVRFVDAFPMTVTGKIQKFKIREAEIEAMSQEQT